MKRILVYSHDTFGLGNIRRMLAISSHLVEKDPNVSVLILSGSPMLHAFRIPQRVDYVKLPCLSRTRKGKYVVKSLGLDYDETIRLRSNLILNTFLDFKPDLVLVDKKPRGVSGELSATLEFLGNCVDRPKMVLLLRDILDSPENTSRMWQQKGYHATIDSYYDRVLVVGSPEIFDLPREYEFPASSLEKVEFCGYLERERGSRSRKQIRAELGVDREPLVFVTAGGGEDGFRLLSTYLDGLQGLKHPAPFSTLLLGGPEMSDANRACILEAVSANPSVDFLEFTDDIMSYMEAADLVISMGGYNTICEILTVKKRAIVVPRTEPVQEQWIRARKMDALGLLSAIHPDSLSPEGLLRAVGEQLAMRNVHATGLYAADMGGLPRVSRWISGLLEQAEARPFTPPLGSNSLQWFSA